MRNVVYGAGAAIALMLGALLWAWMLDPVWRVERRAQIAAPPGPVFAYISILGNWPEWTAWNTREYPSLAFEYAGPAWGVGATQRWVGGPLEGELRVAEFRPGEYLEYELTLGGTGERLRGSLQIEAHGEGSELVWRLWGESQDHPLAKASARLQKPRIERQFAKALANLQTRFHAEPQAQHARQDP